MEKEKKIYTVGVDIGSSSVVMAVGERGADGGMNILGVASHPVENGVHNGTVHNVKTVGQAIAAVKAELEQELEIRIDEAYAGVGGESVCCAYCSDSVAVKDANRCISASTVRSLHARVNEIAVPAEYEVVDRIPQEFTLCNNGAEREESNPEGCFGDTLSLRMMLVLCKRQQIESVNMSFHQAGLKIKGVYANVAVVPEVLLSSADRDEGVAVVDLGGGTTDIAVVRGGRLRYAGSLPIGASSINDDLCQFGIVRREVDQVKRKYGSAFARDVDEASAITVTCSGQANRAIHSKNLALIIEARVRDFIDLISAELRFASCSDMVPGGIVLTGGSARLRDIEQLFAQVSGRPVQLAKATAGLDEESREHVSFADTAAVALVVRAAAQEPCVVVAESKSAGTTKKPATPAAPTGGRREHRPYEQLTEEDKNVINHHNRPHVNVPGGVRPPKQEPEAPVQAPKPVSEQVPEHVVPDTPKPDGKGGAYEPKPEKERKGGFWKSMGRFVSSVLGDDDGLL